MIAAAGIFDHRPTPAGRGGRPPPHLTQPHEPRRRAGARKGRRNSPRWKPGGTSPGRRRKCWPAGSLATGCGTARAPATRGGCSGGRGRGSWRRPKLLDRRPASRAEVERADRDRAAPASPHDARIGGELLLLRGRPIGVQVEELGAVQADPLRSALKAGGGLGGKLDIAPELDASSVFRLGWQAGQPGQPCESSDPFDRGPAIAIQGRRVEDPTRPNPRRHR